MATKKNFGNRVKMAWLRSMEVLGTSASNLADNAKTRANELNYEARRREILTELSLKAFELWQKGVELPEPLMSMCREIDELDEKLNMLRAQKYARLAAEGKVPPIEGDDFEQAPADDAQAEAAPLIADVAPEEAVPEEVAPEQPATEEAAPAEAAPEGDEQQ